MPVIELQGKEVSYRVRASRRAKRVSLRYRPSDGLEVVYPAGSRKPAPESLLRERADWILRAIDRMNDARLKRPRRSYCEGEEFPFRGASYQLQLETSKSLATSSARLTDDRLLLSLPADNSSPTSDIIRRVILGFYRQQAKIYLPRRLDELAERHGFTYKQVRIKNQKTRWGSCSAKRNINLNLRLMMAPDEAIDYVLIHELCHLRELNHTPAFWALVAGCCPDYRHWQAWFKQHGHSLNL